MVEIEKGREHIEAQRIIELALENGDLPTLEWAKNHQHPSVNGGHFRSILAFTRQHPKLAFSATVISTGITLMFGLRKIRMHERSARQVREETIQIFEDPLSVPFERTCRIGETAISTGHGKEFITNLCNSSVRHALDQNDKGETTKTVESFWSSLNPHHPIFSELLDPDTRDTRHRDQKLRIVEPYFQSHYKAMIDEMTAAIEKLDPKLGKRINESIYKKLGKH